MAYAERTEITVEKSIAEIIRIIKRAGAEQIGQMESPAMFAIQFTLAGRMIRFRVPLPTIDEMPQYDGRNARLTDRQKLDRCHQAARQKARALFLVIKAKLESIESNVESFEEAFLANVVMADGKTLYERTQGTIALEYETGRVQALLPGLAP